MRKDYSDITFILDKSGSMDPLAKETISGYNAFIRDQKLVAGTATASLVLFDTWVKTVYSGVDIKEVKTLTSVDYRPSGWTALFDAMGQTINSVGQRLDAMQESDKPDKVIIVVMTDGEENNSREFTKSQIAEMVDRQSKQYNWQFVYLGANQDSFLVGGSLSFPKISTRNYDYTPIGTMVAYSAVSDSLTKYRKGATNCVDLGGTK